MNTHVLGAGQFVEFILTHERNETYSEDEEFSFKYIESITYIGYFVMFAKSYACLYSRCLSCCFSNSFSNSKFGWCSAYAY